MKKIKKRLQTNLVDTYTIIESLNDDNRKRIADIALGMQFANEAAGKRAIKNDSYERATN